MKKVRSSESLAKRCAGSRFGYNFYNFWKLNEEFAK